MSSSINEQSGLPESVSLSDILHEIELTPGEAAAMLTHWAGQHSGGSQTGLSAKLNSAAARTTDPQTYKGNANDASDAAGNRPTSLASASTTDSNESVSRNVSDNPTADDMRGPGPTI